METESDRAVESILPDVMGETEVKTCALISTDTYCWAGNELHASFRDLITWSIVDAIWDVKHSKIRVAIV